MIKNKCWQVWCGDEFVIGYFFAPSPYWARKAAADVANTYVECATKDTSIQRCKTLEKYQTPEALTNAGYHLIQTTTGDYGIDVLDETNSEKLVDEGLAIVAYWDEYSYSSTPFDKKMEEK